MTFAAPLFLNLAFLFPAFLQPSVVPSTPPDIQGAVKSVIPTEGPGRILGEIEVVAVAGGVPARALPSEGVAATVEITADTEIVLEPERPAGFSDVRPGGFVRIWFESRVLPSYPLQARAKFVLIGSPRAAGAPPPPFGREPIRVGGNVQADKLLHYVPPIYPEELKAQGITDEIILQVTADEVGNVEDVRRVRGHPRLAEAAKDAVRQWKYEPTYLGGQPVSVIFTVRVMMSPE